jgi:LMBR1 domain-containing protein 1
MKIHPMTKGRTLLNSLIFNLQLVLFCAPAIIHFQTEIFAKYMIYSVSVEMFVVEVRRMTFFSFFFDYNIFYYAFILITLITFFFLLFKPRSDRLNIQKMIDERNKPV